MAHGTPQVLNLDATVREQAMTNRQPHLTHNVQPVAKQEVIVAMYAAAQGILQRQHCTVSRPLLNGLLDRRGHHYLTVDVWQDQLGVLK